MALVYPLRPPIPAWLIVGWAASPRPSLLYRFTVKLMALLVPTLSVTRTRRAPKAAVAGTRHRMRSAPQETYLVHLTLPNFTKLAPRARPKPVPVMTTIAPRWADVGDSP